MFFLSLPCGSVYADHTPPELSNVELFVGISKMVAKALYRLFRWTLATVVWLALTPLLTGWTFQIFLHEDLFLKDPLSLWERLGNVNLVVYDAFIGFIVTVSIFAVAFGLVGLKEYLENHRHLFQDGDMDIENDGRGGAMDVAMGDDAEIADMPAILHDNVAEDQADRFDIEDEAYESDESDDVMPREELLSLRRRRAQRLHHQHHLEEQLEMEPQEFQRDQPQQHQQLQQQHEPHANAEAREDAEDDDFETLLGLRGNIFNLFSSFFMVFLMNCGSMLFLLSIPINTGRFLLKDPETLSTLDILSPHLKYVLVGYAGILSMAALWGGCVMLFYWKFHDLEIDPITRAMFEMSKLVLLLAKVIFSVLLDFVIVPIMYALLTDLGVSEFFGATVESRFEQLSKHPIIFTFERFALGYVILINLTAVIKTIRQHCHPRVLWFLRDPDDPQFSYMRETIRNPLYSIIMRRIRTFLVFSVTILLVTRTPIKLARMAMPGLFPLQFLFKSPLGDKTTMFLFFVVSFSIGRIQPHQYIASMIRAWIDSIGYALALDEYLFDENYDPHQESRSSMALKVIAFLFVAWSTIQVAVAAFIIVPNLLGRTILSHFSLQDNDFMFHTVGMYAICGTMYMVKRVRAHLLRQDISGAVTQVRFYTAMVSIL